MSEALAKRRLKLWIRLLRVTRASEAHLRDYLRRNHATTLPRFDVMAALYRMRSGVSMSELSRRLLVSNGNATTVVDRLEADGLVRRTPSPTDRRSVFVALTERGEQEFAVQAAGHEQQVDGLFSTLSEADLDRVGDVLKRVFGEAQA